MQKTYKISNPVILPCVPVVPSILRLTLTDGEGNSQTFEDESSLDALAQRYGIKIEGDLYDLTSLNNRTCTLLNGKLTIL